MVGNTDVRGRSVKSENSEKESEFEIQHLKGALEGSQFYPGLSKLADQKMLLDMWCANFCGTNEHQLLVVHMITKKAFKNRIVVP